MFKKLSSFTIVELTVSLLISSIVIVIIYYAYFLFNNQFNQHSDKAMATGDFFLFRTALQSDFDHADVITDSVGRLLLKRPGFDDIRYEPVERRIVRYSQQGTDSFAVQSDEWITQALADNVSLIKYASMRIHIGKEVFKVIFKKQYSAAQVVTAENNQDE